MLILIITSCFSSIYNLTYHVNYFRFCSIINKRLLFFNTHTHTHNFLTAAINTKWMPHKNISVFMCFMLPPYLRILTGLWNYPFQISQPNDLSFFHIPHVAITYKYTFLWSLTNDLMFLPFELLNFHNISKCIKVCNTVVSSAWHWLM